MTREVEEGGGLWPVMHPSEVVLTALAIPLPPGATSALDQRWRKRLWERSKRARHGKHESVLRMPYEMRSKGKVRYVIDFSVGWANLLLTSSVGRSGAAPGREGRS